ncbi:tetraacyldisaccharide 4'-kinase [Piscinibacter sp. XHJ-5]|uniref:tetraacyldisaccharide 4'-kinase n=1 Tax=Piscinibacter sp. XHJ-5 TaxID=3037797 RepID=UPI00245337FE|nr:tetraacyldisaccharide 4'-kinase [Piscinibacter sp. XHJ-5]
MARASASQRLQQAWLSRGPLACSLLPLAAAYGALVLLRKGLMRLGVLRPQTLAVPVIVVGNLIAGGAGKTPAVMAVVAMLLRRGRRPGIVSRGHGRSGDAVLEVLPNTPAARSGDEPRLLRMRAGVPVVVGRDRVEAARALLRVHPDVDVIVSDDGLQHRRLPRSAQVLVFDERGAGNGWLLPAGPLREPMPAQVSPGTLVLYNAAAPSTALPGHLARRSLPGLVPLREWWNGAPPSMQALRALVGKPVVACAGIAHPARFFDMLSGHGLSTSALPLPDHHDFAEVPWPPGTSDVIVTEKDAVKLDTGRIGATRVWVAPLDFETGDAFEAELLRLLPPASTRKPDGYPIA